VFGNLAGSVVEEKIFCRHTQGQTRNEESKISSTQCSQNWLCGA